MLTDALPRNTNRAGFLESDRIKTLDLPQGGRLLAITKSIESAMKAGQSAAIRRAWADFLAATSDFYELPDCGIRVLAARPLRVREGWSSELFGDYNVASNGEQGVIPMNPKNLITLSILSCFIFAFAGFNSERNVQTQRDETRPSLLSFVDMNTYTLVLSDPITRAKAKVDLKRLPGWPGPAPEHTLLLPDGKKVLVTYMASATEPVGIAVIKINSINWTAGTTDVQVVKNLETDKEGTRSTFSSITQTSPDQYINKKVEDDWSRPVFAQLHGPTLLPHSRFAYLTMWTDDRIVGVDLDADKLLASQRFGNASNHLHGVFFNDNGTLGLGVGYFYDESNLSVFRPNRQTGALELLGEIHLGTADRYAAFIHNAFWLDDRFAIAGTMQFGPTSLTPAKASIIGPSIWLVDTRTMKASKIIGTAKAVDDSGVLRSASWITVAGDKLFVAEEDSLDASYANDGFVAVFDFSNREHPSFVKRLRPGRELPADFSVSHSLSTSVDGKSVVVESYTSGYVLEIDTRTLAVSEIANPKEGFKMPHGAWIAGRKN